MGETTASENCTRELLMVVKMTSVDACRTFHMHSHMMVVRPTVRGGFETGHFSYFSVI